MSKASATRRLSIKPAPRLLWLALLLAVVALVWACVPLWSPLAGWAAPLQTLWAFGMLLVAAVAVADFILALPAPAFRVERQCRANVPVNQWTSVRLRLHHPFKTRVSLSMREKFTAGFDVSNKTLQTKLVPDRYTDIEYRLRPLQRGDCAIDGLDLLLASSLGLWQRVLYCPCRTDLKVYPDFSAITGYNLMATDNHVSQLGIRRVPRRGEGMEFFQLREYRQGDSNRQIDWKASANKQKLISKEYQDERDQQIITMIDSGRRMRSNEDGLGHFDHAINASVLLSYVALRQGDSVGLMSFGGNQRWLPSSKGAANINRILNHVYDLQPTTNASDYSGAAQFLVQRQRKRSMVILVTNTRDEDVDDLMASIHLLRKHHLILLASIVEPVLKQVMEQPVRSLEDAYRYCGGSDYLARRRKMQRKLRDSGVFVLDVLPEQLPIAVINSYLEIKRAGYL